MFVLCTKTHRFEAISLYSTFDAAIAAAKAWVGEPTTDHPSLQVKTHHSRTDQTTIWRDNRDGDRRHARVVALGVDTGEEFDILT